MIWMGLMPPGGTGNIFHEMAVRRNKHRCFILPCELSVGGNLQHSWPYIKSREPYVIDLETKYGTGLRLIDWNEESLQYLLNSYTDDIWLGTFNTATFLKVKNILREQCLSISIGYTSNDYQFVKKKWARWQTGLIMENQQYLSYRQKFLSSHALENYLYTSGSTDFGYDIPEQRFATADVELNIRELFNRKSMENILESLSVCLDDNDWKFYDTYCRASG